ncbi:hypothetical protein LTR85_004780 [Meristemomyces frigidus]|nr:hypothetical protein LTR85_004780 [Meristemomyces frigidus]
MPYLPNEIWLDIIAYCDPRDLWLSLRTTNRQLSECVEQYFGDDVLPKTVTSLPIALPTYDIRQPMRGKAIFHHTRSNQSNEQASNRDRASYSLSKTDPEHYRAQFLDRWEGMREKAGGKLGDHLRWDMQLNDKVVTMGLKEARIEPHQTVGAEAAQLSFDWKPTMSRFFH